MTPITFSSATISPLGSCAGTVTYELEWENIFHPPLSISGNTITGIHTLRAITGSSHRAKIKATTTANIPVQTVYSDYFCVVVTDPCPGTTINSVAFTTPLEVEIDTVEEIDLLPLGFPWSDS
jgi:hypothetical protein